MSTTGAGGSRWVCHGDGGGGDDGGYVGGYASMIDIWWGVCCGRTPTRRGRIWEGWGHPAWLGDRGSTSVMRRWRMFKVL
jgi:hypothetical protein